MRHAYILFALLIALAGIVPHAALAQQRPAAHHTGMTNHPATHDATACADSCIGCAVPETIAPTVTRVAELRSAVSVPFVAAVRISFKSMLDPPPPRAAA